MKKWRHLWSTKRYLASVTAHFVCLFRQREEALEIDLQLALYLEAPGGVERLLKAHSDGAITCLGLPAKPATYEGVEMARVTIPEPSMEMEMDTEQRSNWYWRATDRYAAAAAAFCHREAIISDEEWSALRQRELQLYRQRWAPCVTVDDAMRWRGPWTREKLQEFMSPVPTVRVDQLWVRPEHAWLLLRFGMEYFPEVVATWLVHQLRSEPDTYSHAIAWWVNDRGEEWFHGAMEAECSPVASFVLALRAYAGDDGDEQLHMTLDGLRQLDEQAAYDARRELALRLCNAWEGCDEPT